MVESDYAILVVFEPKVGVDLSGSVGDSNPCVLLTVVLQEVHRSIKVQQVVTHLDITVIVVNLDLLI